MLVPKQLQGARRWCQGMLWKQAKQIRQKNRCRRGGWPTSKRHRRCRLCCKLILFHGISKSDSACTTLPIFACLRSWIDQDTSLWHSFVSWSLASRPRPGTRDNARQSSAIRLCLYYQSLQLSELVLPYAYFLSERFILRSQLLCDFLDLDTAVDLCSFVCGDFGFEIGKVGLLSFAESTLGGSILCFTFGERFCLGRLTTRFGASWKDPFLCGLD